MDQRTLQMIQRGLVAAVSLVLALVVVTAFRGLLEPPDDTLPRRTTTTTDAALATDDGVTTTSVTSNGAETTTTGATATTDICVEEEPDVESATILQVFFPCGESFVAGASYVYRVVPITDLVLTTTIKEMTKGPDQEETALGFISPFPDDAGGSFLGASIDTEENIAYLEFDSGIFPDGVDTTEGSQLFLSTLNANVFQFTSIDAVEYRVSGSCAAFWQNLGSECQVITRSQWESRTSP